LTQGYVRDRADVNWGSPEVRAVKVAGLDWGVRRAAVEVHARGDALGLAGCGFREGSRGLRGGAVGNAGLLRGGEGVGWYLRSEAGVVREFANAFEAGLGEGGVDEWAGVQSRLESEFGRRIAALRGVVGSRVGVGEGSVRAEGEGSGAVRQELDEAYERVFA